MAPLLFCSFALLLLCLASCATPIPPSPTSPPPTADRFPALLTTGEAYAAGGARSAAEQAYREAAAVRPSDPTPYLQLARLYLDWNRLPEGLAALDAAEERGAQVARWRVEFLAAQGDWAGVVTHSNAALASNPADAPARRRLAQACVALGWTDAAQTQYRALLELDPADGGAHESLGVLLASSDPAAALEHLHAVATPLAGEVATALQVEDPVYRLALIGQTCLRHGQPALATVTLQQAVTLNPAYADAQALLGQALDQQGRAAEARIHLETAARLAPDMALARSLLGLHDLQGGDAAAARPHLEAAYDLDPHNPALSLYLAHLYAALGRYDVAAIWMDEALRLAPDAPEIWAAAARFYLEQGVEEQRGQEAALGLLRLAPQSAVAHDLAGWACFLTAQPELAEEYLLRALEIDPLLASAYDHLGQLYDQQGRTEEARQAFTRALDRATDPQQRAAIADHLSGRE